MEPGFWHIGPRELVAIAMAVVIIVDWSVQRYVIGRSRAAPDVTDV